MFKRNVMINNIVYSSHRIGSIWHILGDASVVFVQHVEGDVFDGNWIETQHVHELDWSLSLEDAEEWLKTLPEYTEYVNPDSEQIDSLEELLGEISAMLDDDQAASVPQAYREWEPGTTYQAGDRRRYEDILYKCLVQHTSQGDQTPDIAPSLWARILAPDPGVIPDWEQPDSTNPYMTGDKVRHNGHVWMSDVDNNVWEPGVYGWTQQD